MNAGKLDRRVTIQSPASTQDAFGAPQESWTDILTVWAAIDPATGKEVYAASGFISELSHVVTIRYPAVPVATNMRVMYGTRTFLVQGVTDPAENHIQLNLYCLERT